MASVLISAVKKAFGATHVIHGVDIAIAEAEVQVVEPTGSELQVVAKMGGEDIIAVFRERHRFQPGDKIRLKPNPHLVHLFDDAAGKRLNA